MIQVSVILPIYNGAKTLNNTLESLVEQSFSDFEVVACIDGSTDDSELILLQFASKFKKLTILKNKVNRGLGPTMNRLVHNTQGDYIAVAEQDDYYYPDRLKLQVELLDTNKSIGLVSGIAEFCNGDRVHGKFPGLLVHGKHYPTGIDMFILNYKYHVKVVNSCMMFRKSTHVDNGLYFTQHYPSISVDWTYILRFSLLSNIHGLPHVLVRLDRRPERDSVTSNKGKQFKATRELLRSFAYEYSDIITDTDYKYAMRSQYLLEISSKNGLAYVRTWLWFFIQCPFEKRYINNLKRRISQKIKIFSN
ncbi:glycosyltransferase family 2 protein [Bizionia psychrotolerans]|uniref:glycosyltransferase family 2 protein n=1 Tax=Bizionia psychrotolerans TaxID=1492901 RepID=UPI000651AD06|nr:glycosyltransferase family A protein [Bizionia psychrotolerans]